MISHPDESFKVTLGVFTLNPYREMESCLRFWPKENKDTWDNEFSWGFTLGLVNFSKNKFFFAFQDFFFLEKKMWDLLVFMIVTENFELKSF